MDNTFSHTRTGVLDAVAGDVTHGSTRAIHRGLKKEGIFEEAQAQAIKEVVAWQLAEAMGRRQAPRHVASILDAARELGIRDAQDPVGGYRAGQSRFVQRRLVPRAPGRRPRDVRGRPWPERPARRNRPFARAVAGGILTRCTAVRERLSAGLAALAGQDAGDVVP